MPKNNWVLLLVERGREKLSQGGLYLLKRQEGHDLGSLFNEEIIVYPPSPVSKCACVAPLRVFQGSECVITQVEPCRDVVMNPPDRVWKEGT